jgi:hypothetical protein
MKLEFSGQFFEKRSNMKFHENPSIGSRAVPSGQTAGRTDRHEETNNRFSQLCDRAKKKTDKSITYQSLVLS